MNYLIIGGSKSGKSEAAEKIALTLSREPQSMIWSESLTQGANASRVSLNKEVVPRIFEVAKNYINNEEEISCDNFIKYINELQKHGIQGGSLQEQGIKSSKLKKHDIKEFQDLMDYACDQEYDRWFPLLCDNSAYVVNQYIKSQRHRSFRVNPETGEVSE